MRHPQDAEDVVQHAYIRAYRAFDQFSGDNSAAWIMTIVRNVCLTQLGKNSNNKVVYLDADLLKQKIHQHQIEQHEHQHCPESLAINAAQSSELLDAISQLSIEYREVILLREFQGFSYRQIAEVIDSPPGTVMSRLSRARRDLRKILGSSLQQEIRG